MPDVDWAEICDRRLGAFTLAALPPTMQLPALPHAVTLFMERAKAPDTTLKELARIVETDTGLTIELLKHVNSAFHGVRNKSTSAQQALSMLGMRQSRTFILTTGMQAAVKSRQSKLINQSCFWNASLQKALFAQEVARLLKADEEVAFAGGLLQDYLLPVITNDLFDDYLRFTQSRADQPACLVDYERTSIGFDHALAGAALARRWHLPDELVCCILHHHDGLRILADAQLKRTAVAAVALSALLPDQLRQQYDGLEHLLALSGKWGSFDVGELAERVDAKHAELDLGVRNDYPLSRRCQPVVGEAVAYDDGTLKAAAVA